MKVIGEFVSMMKVMMMVSMLSRKGVMWLFC